MPVNVVTLANLEVGQHGRIFSLTNSNPNKVRKLLALGLYPGLPIRVIQKFPSYVIQVGHTQLAVDRETAQSIEVAKEPGAGAACRRYRYRHGLWRRLLNHRDSSSPG